MSGERNNAGESELLSRCSQILCRNTDAEILQCRVYSRARRSLYNTLLSVRHTGSHMQRGYFRLVKVPQEVYGKHPDELRDRTCG